MSFAKQELCPIVFMTGDKKEDWWIKKQGKIISPDFLLRKEFQEEVGQPFWMYRTHRFLDIAKENLSIDVNPESIEEANTVTDIDLAEEQISNVDLLALQQIRTSKTSLVLLEVTAKISLEYELASQKLNIAAFGESLERISAEISLPNEKIFKAFEAVQLHNKQIGESLLRAINSISINSQSLSFPAIKDSFKSINAINISDSIRGGVTSKIVTSACSVDEKLTLCKPILVPKR